MTFWQLTVEAPAEASDGLTNFLWEHGALGVVEEESPREPPRLRAFFPGTASSAALVRAVGTYCASLQSLGFPVPPAPPEITPLLDGDWARAWQQSFTPIEIGARLLIVPPWEAWAESAAGGRVQVIIEPGRAFGTGHHGSTGGCLALLEEALLSRGAQALPVLDIGTGTGILAIAAVKLGAPAVLAIDIDPDAIAAARHNAQCNGCADRIELALEGPETVPARAAFRLVTANLLSHTHLELVAQYERLVAPGGCLILGGILADERQRVGEALGTAGFEVQSCLVTDGWASLLIGLAARR
jgi:ribosomal protein L11 methyltransferase